MWDGVGVESKIECVGEVCETEWPIPHQHISFCPLYYASVGAVLVVAPVDFSVALLKLL